MSGLAKANTSQQTRQTVSVNRNSRNSGRNTATEALPKRHWPISAKTFSPQKHWHRIPPATLTSCIMGFAVQKTVKASSKMPPYQKPSRRRSTSPKRRIRKRNDESGRPCFFVDIGYNHGRNSANLEDADNEIEQEN